MTRFIVSVDVDTESDCYLTPARFEDEAEAMEHAIGIARWLREVGNPPGVWVRGEAEDRLWTVEELFAFDWLNGPIND
ncbi:hypothetical protein QA645_17030 [Bradyrhizobium sp. CIAT3101]|uniref:hypothetical protein n=1 Tax=Bradyrhizobium sp. CIAT3101 TaxID=439387 RepID=UPI0024B1163A|nr:hypothetical protein [Bradyrhizobium sp. CIAT3101]WFU84376.1 hypothetical protein QA645_17030 [Bradyrhizobium sp. CIAT3101]